MNCHMLIMARRTDEGRDKKHGENMNITRNINESNIVQSLALASKETIKKIITQLPKVGTMPGNSLLM